MSGIQTTFLVSNAEHGMRLDHFLTLKLENQHSRSQIADWITNEIVFVSGKVVTKTGYKLTENQTITFYIPQPPLLALTPHHVSFEVLAEEQDFLIINKPAGLVVHHSASAPDTVTLVHGLLDRYPEFRNFDGSERPGIVHRLDKDTSGLILIARNPQALTALSALFKNRSIHKQYHALVHGVPLRSGTISLPIGRHPVHRHKMGINGIAARTATTHYKTLTYFKENTALIELTIVTGRTHQIRVHCAHEKFPVLGDAVYGSASPLIGRQALHARSLSFTYKGTPYSYTAPYPVDFIHALAALEPYTDDHS